MTIHTDGKRTVSNAPPRRLPDPDTLRPRRNPLFPVGSPMPSTIEALTSTAPADCPYCAPDERCALHL